jgi:hypothetical protein
VVVPVVPVALVVARTKLVFAIDLKLKGTI